MTSAQTSLSMKLRNGGIFTEAERVVITERAKQRCHGQLLEAYRAKQAIDGIGPTLIGKRIGRAPSRVNRALNFSSNMTIATVALMAAALGRDMKISFPAFGVERNYAGLTKVIEIESKTVGTQIIKNGTFRQTNQFPAETSKVKTDA